MLFWLLALVVTAIACAALYYAGAAYRTATPVGDELPELAHLRLQLKEIETDAATGRREPAEALRRVIALDGPTADRETDLGEALMMAANGDATGEPLTLFASAAARDPAHVRSRYYLASEATRRGDFAAAKADWEALIALGKGDEPWLPNAQDGLAAAEAGLRGDISGVDPDTVAAMVDGLEARLTEQGGTIEEWTRLIRSRLVQGLVEQAQQAYEAARKAYPDPGTRTELDVLAADNGLVASK
jgi:cytochrome c-type biogenesis protein CcmH